MLGRRKSRHESKLKALVEVNMTPLMDLTFMLLILFIITVPILDYTTEVEPPKMTTDTPIQEADDEAIHVTLDKDGNCGVNGTPVAMTELQQMLSSLQSLGRTRVRIRASGVRPYEEVIALLRTAKNCGLGVQLETQSE